MENNTIPQDEMDRLLRETFVNSPDAETDKISDMMSQHVYGNNWGAVPPIDKAQQFAAKKLFFKGISLNTIIGTGVVATGIAVATGIYLASPSKNKEVASEENVTAKPIPTFTQKTIVDEDVVQLTEIIHPAPSLAFTQLDIPEMVANEEPTEPLLSASANINVEPKLPQNLIAEKPTYINGTGSKPTDVPKARYKYVLIPDISSMEAAANEKRKQEMIRQVQRMDKREWAFIPMGTTHINGDAVSVQAFFMQTHEVTNLQYRTFLYDLVLNDKLREYEKAAVYDSAWITKAQLAPFVQNYFWNPEYDNYPVVNVSYEGVKMYCDWLTRLVNYNNSLKGAAYINDIRVPVASEWIYAAKADHDTTHYAWNGIYLRNSKGSFQANFQSGRGMNDYDGADVTAPAISYFPNDWGLYNMCGNVAEMTRPTENDMNIKGGAWNTTAEKMKIATDNHVPLNDVAAPNVGFRPVFTYTGDQ